MSEATMRELARCGTCDEPVDPSAQDIVLGLEQVWVPGEGFPETRWSVDGGKCYFHESHLPAGATYVYRLVRNNVKKECPSS